MDDIEKYRNRPTEYELALAKNDSAQNKEDIFNALRDLRKSGDLLGLHTIERRALAIHYVETGRA